MSSNRYQSIAEEKLNIKASVHEPCQCRPIHIWNTNLVITVPADVLAHNSAELSAATLQTTTSNRKFSVSLAINYFQHVFIDQAIWSKMANEIFPDIVALRELTLIYISQPYNIFTTTHSYIITHVPGILNSYNVTEPLHIEPWQLQCNSTTINNLIQAALKDHTVLVNHFMCWVTSLYLYFVWILHTDSTNN